MVRSIAELRETPDEQLMQEHDRDAKSTVAGTGYYLDELERRSRERAASATRELAEASNRLARRSFWLALSSTILSGIATVAAVIALFLNGA